jgi:benzoyl-CoA reductase/2-hydroxyglutaryl-CoA dehydratase subunit BcrC/BadD/HgdB
MRGHLTGIVFWDTIKSVMKIGITTTIPAEILLAAGCIPVDLNNVFISREDSSLLVEKAELYGLPRTICSWVKGIYGLLRGEKCVDAVIPVVQGDCSNTFALMENLVHDGIRCIPFAYPHSRTRSKLERGMKNLASRLGTTWKRVKEEKIRLDAVREQARLIDEMTWRENLVTGFENHSCLVSCSDFKGDPDSFSREMSSLAAEASKRNPLEEQVRLGFVGVPPIFSDLYQFLEKRNARAVFNETQRQFSMPARTPDIVEQYLSYTYPYDVFGRIDDIRAAASERRLDGIIHYVQSFCHHQMEDRILRESIPLPVFTLEGDRPGPVDARTALRLESFIQLLADRRESR